jgi:pimeloyl-ACP methyl ester carboxylesterase
LVYRPFLTAAAIALGTVASPAAPAAPTQFLAQPDGRIAFDDTGGDGRLVVLVPGMGDLRGEYRFLAPVLAQAGFRAVSMDVRGCGQTSAEWPDYSAHAVGRDVRALIDHLHAGPAVVIGTSFAAGAALWAAQDEPASVRGLVLISPMVTDVRPNFAMRATLALAFAGPWRSSVWGWYWNSLFPLRKPADQEAYRAALLANLREPGRMSALHTMLTLSKADTAAIIDQPHRPALLIVGTGDPDFNDPTADGKSLAGRLHADLLLVDGAGHYPQAETPEQVDPRIVTFLRQLP